jgi:virulence-associated protein VapD
MIKEYVNKLIDELPEHIISKLKKQKKMDIILDGGIFNGSYLIGALYFLKEIERRKYIKIEKLSGCSIGSISAILYFIDELDMIPELYNLTIKHFKEEHNLNIVNNGLDKIKAKLPEDFYKKINGKLYISYYNIEKRRKITKSKFKDNNQLIEYIRRSCFVPFMINGDLTHENKYIDGMFPHIFSQSSFKGNNNNNKKKTLYLDLLGNDKMKYILSVKNEQTNYHRILAGVLDIHLFFIKESKTQMCSYVENWGFGDFMHQRLKKYIIETIIIWFVYVIYIMKKYVPEEMYENNIFFKIISKIIEDVYIIMIENYCF